MWWLHMSGVRVPIPYPQFPLLSFANFKLRHYRKFHPRADRAAELLVFFPFDGSDAARETGLIRSAKGLTGAGANQAGRRRPLEKGIALTRVLPCRGPAQVLARRQGGVLDSGHHGFIVGVPCRSPVKLPRSELAANTAST